MANVVLQTIKITDPQKEGQGVNAKTTYLITSTTVNNEVFQTRRRFALCFFFHSQLTRCNRFKEFKKLYETIERDMKFDNQIISPFPKKDWMGLFHSFFDFFFSHILRTRSF